MLPTMRPPRSLPLFFAVAGLALSPHIAASVQGTGGGVTTTVGNTDPTAPSTDVQSQSSGFVQQNQQLASGGAAGTQTVTGDPSQAQSGARGQTTGAAAGGPGSGTDTSAKGADGKPAAPGTPGAPAAAAAAPAQPAAPPPDYVSVVRHLNRQTGEKAKGGDASAEQLAPLEAGKPPAEPQAAAPAPPPKPPVNPPRANRVPADADKHAATEHPAAPPPATGGRGAAPDGYTFYIGLIIAGALLAFAASIWLRTGGGNPTPQ